MAYRGFCQNEDHGCLFDVPDYDAFSEKPPIQLTCQHCQTVYRVRKDRKLGIVYRVKGSQDEIAAEKY